MYHAVRGPFGKRDAADVVPLVAQARLLHIHGGETSGTPRGIYPYSFSFHPSSVGPQAAIFFIAAANDWRSVASVWESASLVDSANRIASRSNVTNYGTLAGGAGGAEWVATAWQEQMLRPTISFLSARPHLSTQTNVRHERAPCSLTLKVPIVPLNLLLLILTTFQ